MTLSTMCTVKVGSRHFLLYTFCLLVSPGNMPNEIQIRDPSSKTTRKIKPIKANLWNLNLQSSVVIGRKKKEKKSGSYFFDLAFLFEFGFTELFSLSTSLVLTPT